MPFEVLFDGEVVVSVSEQVTGVRIQTTRGETSVTGIAPNEGAIQLILDRVAPGGPPRLDQVEESEMQKLRDRSEPGTVVGFPRDHQVNIAGLKGGQGYHNETTREGGVDLAQRRGSALGAPSKDLSEGLLPHDTKTRTARLEAFADHGDADRAIRDNKPGSEGRTAPVEKSETTTTVSESTTEEPKESEAPKPQVKSPKSDIKIKK